MGLTYAEVEDAVLRVLDPLRLERGGPCLTVSGYNGELSSLEMLEGVRGRVPAVLVVLSGSSFDPPASAAFGTQRRWLSLTVFVMSLSWRGSAQARDGAYDLLDQVRDLLSGSDLGLGGVLYCYPRSEDLMNAGLDRLVVYRAEYVLSYPKHTWAVSQV